MIPSANRAEANRPATGRSASAASAAVRTSVIPAEWRVAAVARMMAIAMVWEKAIPRSVSSRILRNCLGAVRGAWFSGLSRGDVATSSASWELCQKNR